MFDISDSYFTNVRFRSIGLQTPELVIHPHFVLVYEVDSQWGKVYILRVLHTAQKWP
ncbi:type II toxin-antitoxin system RelE/ParE family toxin [Escherichia coli]|nr:type II toxin-antitoxin system RelE/ParE family toxin [Escherichia coli]